jgi:hypothetical protein
MHAAVQLLGVDDVDQARGRLYGMLGELTDPMELGRFGTPTDLVHDRFAGRTAPHQIVFERELDRDTVMRLLHALWGDPLREDFVNRPDDEPANKPPAKDQDAHCLACGERMTGMYNGRGFHIRATDTPDGKGEVELRLNVGCHEGSTFLSKEMWEAIGKQGGWL